MNLRLVFALEVLSLALCQCQSDGWCTFAVLANQAGYKVSDHLLGPLAGPPPDAMALYDKCRLGTPDVTDPAVEDAAFMARPPAGVCESAYLGSDPCVACVHANCCTETTTCLSEGTCTCLIGSKLPGISWPADAPCGAEDAAYTAENACLSAHCMQECL